MFRLRKYFRRKTLLRRWPAKLVLLGYVWMCCGGTLPASLFLTAEAAKNLAEKDRSVPFPCMDKPCGCRSAEQCYKSCCCSSKAERIAWAKEHQVGEKYLALAEESEEKPTPAKSCCVKKEVPACCAAKATSACCEKESKTASCCQKALPKTKKASEQPAKEKESSQRQLPGVSALAALRCAGLQAGALGVPLSLPVNLEIRLPLEAPFLGLIFQMTPLFSNPAYSPDTPPPNSILA